MSAPQKILLRQRYFTSLWQLMRPKLEVHHTGDLILTLPVAAYALFRYLYLVLAKGFGEDTAAEVLRDRGLFWAVIAYIALTSTILFRG